MTKIAEIARNTKVTNHSGPWIGMAAFATAAIVTLLGCGTRKTDDDSTRKQADTKAAAVPKTLVLGQTGDAALKPATPGTCSVDLAQETVFDPAVLTETSVFTGVVSTDCAADGKRPVLYVSTESTLKIGGTYACKYVTGEYKIRCDGQAVAPDKDGVVRISLGTSSGSDAKPIKMRLTFEK